MPVSIDEDGRERLVFIDGEVPLSLRPIRTGASPILRWRLSQGCCAGCMTPPVGSTRLVSPGTTVSLTLRAERSCATTTWSLRTWFFVTASPLRCSTSSSLPLGAPSTTSPTSRASVSDR